MVIVISSQYNCSFHIVQYSLCRMRCSLMEPVALCVAT